MASRLTTITRHQEIAGSTPVSVIFAKHLTLHMDESMLRKSENLTPANLSEKILMVAKRALG